MRRGLGGADEEEAERLKFDGPRFPQREFVPCSRGDDSPCQEAYGAGACCFFTRLLLEYDDLDVVEKQVLQAMGAYGWSMDGHHGEYSCLMAEHKKLHEERTQPMFKDTYNPHKVEMPEIAEEDVFREGKLAWKAYCDGSPYFLPIFIFSKSIALILMLISV